MANIVNNIDLDKVAKTVETGKMDKSSLRKPVKMQGEWNFDPSKGYQFRTELSFEKGKQAIEIDSPSFLGGGGNRLGPMAFCVAGITSCFISTLVGIASERGIKLTKLGVNTECIVNFAKTFGLGEDPITEGISFEIDAQSTDANKEKIQELVKLAKERCPAMYSMLHTINIETKLK